MTNWDLFQLIRFGDILEVPEVLLAEQHQDSIVPCDAPFNCSNSIEQIQKIQL